ncbi:hypothetical protein JCM11251_004148 [Rhodosporidiobolus azoricus]
MPREKRQAALKTVKYTDEGPLDSEDEEVEVGKVGKSAKSKGKRKARITVDEDDWSAADDDEEPPKKRRKAPAKGVARVKGRKGKLSAFSEMPLDVLYCIARYLDPLTLLHMSRANKALHSLLASRSANPIWQAVRQAVHLPELSASDLTDMQYTSLVFERNCHLCGRGRASIVDYALRRRWCKYCQRANLLPSNKIEKELESLDDSALKCSLTTAHSVSGRNWAKKAYYCKNDVENISDELSALRANIAAAKSKIKRAEASAVLDEYIREREVIVKAAKTDAEALLKWESLDAASRQQASNDARLARRKAIENRLLGLGFVEQDVKDLYAAWQVVDQPTPLTDAIWTRISQSVIKAAEENKRDRLEREASARRTARRLAIRDYYDRLLAQEDGNAVKRYPSFSTFAQFPHVEQFWRAEDSDVSQQKWDDALDDIKADVEKGMRVIKVNYARTALAAVRFGAGLYNDDLTTRLNAPPPAAIEHEEEPAPYDRTYDVYHELRSAKLNLADSAPQVTDDELTAILSRFTSQFYCTSYNCFTVLPVPAIHEHAQSGHGSVAATGESGTLPAYLFRQLLALLEETGFDDQAETIAELEKLGPVFGCKGCEESRVRRGGVSGYGAFFPMRKVPHEGLTWREILEHYPAHHSDAHYHTDTPQPKIVLSPAGQALLPPGQLERAKAKTVVRERDEREKRAAAAEKRAVEEQAEAQMKEDALIEVVQEEEAVARAEEEADEEAYHEMETVR